MVRAAPSLLLSAKPWEVLPLETGCGALCFITVYHSCYFNIYGARLSCELISCTSLWSESLQGAGPEVILIRFGFCPIYLIKNIVLLGAAFVLSPFLGVALDPP